MIHYWPSISILDLSVILLDYLFLYGNLHFYFLVLPNLIWPSILDHNITLVLPFCYLVLIVNLLLNHSVNSFLITISLCFLCSRILIVSTLLIIWAMPLAVHQNHLLFSFSISLFLSFFRFIINWVCCFPIWGCWCFVLILESSVLTSLFPVHNSYVLHWIAFLDLMTRSVFYSLIRIL